MFMVWQNSRPRLMLLNGSKTQTSLILNALHEIQTSGCHFWMTAAPKKIRVLSKQARRLNNSRQISSAHWGFCLQSSDLFRLRSLLGWMYELSSCWNLPDSSPVLNMFFFFFPHFVPGKSWWVQRKRGATHGLNIITYMGMKSCQMQYLQKNQKTFICFLKLLILVYLLGREKWGKTFNPPDYSDNVTFKHL